MPWRRREPASVHPLADLMFPTMRTPEITTQLTPANFFEKFAGMRHVYETTIDDGVNKIDDGVIKVVGRGPSPEASHEAAQAEWELALGLKRVIP